MAPTTDQHLKIFNLLSQLTNKIEKLGDRSFFHPPASVEAIEKFENRLNIRLPDHLKQFYLHFNGGFFADASWSKEDLANKEILGAIRWNSNYILSLEDILKSYYLEEGSFGSIDLQKQERYSGKRFLPFLHTGGQEILALDASDIHNKTPILDAFHELNSDEWRVIYRSFEDFLLDYIEKEGDIDTVA